MTAGRTCPLHYRHGPEALTGPAEFATDCLYVVGGLYGNPEALAAVEAMAAAEPGARVLFNGDFHWFDADPAAFADLQARVLAHGASAGNVEAELGDPSGAGCGCGYPAYVADATVERSNAIMERLRTACTPEQSAALGALPFTRTVAVGGHRVGVVHGDPAALAGWALAAESLPPADEALRVALGCTVPPTAREQIDDWFRRARVDVFASTHTCLPVLQDHAVDGRPRAIANNGSAGMPNFRGATGGLVTRIATTPATSAQARLALGALFIELVPVAFDAAAWQARFDGWWPPGSPAAASYRGRIDGQVAFTPAQAVRGAARAIGGA